MNKNIKRWLKALRSGEYRQAKAELYNEETNAFCCLGVAVNEYAREHDLHFNDVAFFYESHLPIKVERWLGIDTTLEDRVIDINDKQDYTFNQIADYIEQEQGE